MKYLTKFPVGFPRQGCRFWMRLRGGNFLLWSSWWGLWDPWRDIWVGVCSRGRYYMRYPFRSRFICNFSFNQLRHLRIRIIRLLLHLNLNPNDFCVFFWVCFFSFSFSLTSTYQFMWSCIGQDCELWRFSWWEFASFRTPSTGRLGRRGAPTKEGF